MAAPSDTAGILDTPITDLVGHSDVSVRLHNAIIGSRDLLPLQTVGEYVRAGALAKTKFLGIHNLGIRSADELDVLIREFVAKNPQGNEWTRRNSTEEIPKTQAARTLILGLFAGFRFPDVFLEGPMSARLEKALRGDRRWESTLTEFLDNYTIVCGELLSQLNVGTRSTKELVSLSMAFTGRAFRSWGLPVEDLVDAQVLLFKRHVLSEQSLSRLESFARAVKAMREQKDITQLRPESVSEVVARVVGTLSTRERAVLERRYGIVSGKVETLEEIAEDYSLTRERIRQIESKALRKLSYVSKPLRHAFDDEFDNALIAATKSQGYVRDGETSVVLRGLPPEMRVAIDVLYEDRDECLRAHTSRWHNGWLLAQFTTAEMDQALAQIANRISMACLPIALNEIVMDTPLEKVLAAIELGTDSKVLEGYIFTGYAGARLRRGIRLHRCLVNSGGVRDIRELIATYHQSAPDDFCSVRDALIVMLRFPHLFLNVLDEYWCGLGAAGSYAEAIPNRVEIESVTAEDEKAEIVSDDESIRVILRKILTDFGPLKFVVLRTKASSRLQGKSINSVGPILLTTGEFVRPLPGVYALPEQIPAASSVLFHPPQFLLNEEQARWLAIARFAGEPFGRYPMWTPESEYAICRWSQGQHDPLVFQSLLAVASVEKWPVSAQEREHWLQLKRTQSRYGLRVSPRYPIRQLWPLLDRVLAACVVAVHDGGLSWIGANRVLKLRLDAHVSPGLLALMVSLGALRAPDHWQMFHFAGPNLKDLIERLSKSLHINGTLDWNETVGQEVISDLMSRQSNPKAGWVDENVVDELIAAATQGSDSSLPSLEETDESTSSLEGLLQEVIRSQEAEAARETLNAVLSRNS